MIRIALALLSLSLLAGCGLKEGLERPAPMWGDAREQFQAEQAQREAAEEQARREREAQQGRQTEPDAPEPPESPTSPDPQ